METNEHPFRPSKLIIVPGLLLLLTGGFYYWSQSNQSAIVRDQPKPNPGLSMDNTNQLTHQLEVLRSQLAAAKAENESLTDQIDGLTRLLSGTYDRLSATERHRLDHFYDGKPINHDLTDQKRLGDSLSNQLTLLSGEVHRLNETNQQVNLRNSDLQRTLTQRDATLQTMVSTSAVTGDEFRISAVKANKKATAKAKKVSTLALSFTIPAERGLSGTRDVYLSLIHDSGTVPTRPLIMVTLPSGKQKIPVDAVQTVTFNKTKQQINFSFHPPAELKPGIYRASVYTDNAYLGSVAVQLRDSFWFF